MPDMGQPYLPTNLSHGEDRGLTNTSKQGVPLSGVSKEAYRSAPFGVQPARTGYMKKMGLGGKGKSPSTPPRYG